MIQVAGEGYDPSSAAVHQDTFKQALRHPKTGEMVESLTRWKAINKQHGLEVVGNDLLNAPLTGPKDKITDELIFDRMTKAESILSDPDKRRQREYENQRRVEKYLERRGQKLQVQRIMDEF